MTPTSIFVYQEKVSISGPAFELSEVHIPKCHPMCLDFVEVAQLGVPNSGQDIRQNPITA